MTINASTLNYQKNDVGVVPELEIMPVIHPSTTKCIIIKVPPKLASTATEV